MSLSPASAPDTTTLVAALRDSATSLVETLSTTSTLPPLVIRRLRGVLSRLSPSTAPALLDALLAALPVHPTSGLTHADKVRLLGTLDAAQRVDKGVEVLGRAEEALKLAGRIEGRVEEGQKRRQREWALLQQLMAIRQELEQLAKEEGRPSPLSIIGGGGSGAAKGAAGAPGGRRALGSPPGIGAGDDADEEDDLAELERRVAAKAFSPEAKRVAVRELKRLKKTPPQGAEHGVIRALPLFSHSLVTSSGRHRSLISLPVPRALSSHAGNYIDTLLSVPWTAAEATPLELSKDFVALARKKLDDDHYGLGARSFPLKPSRRASHP